MNSVLVEVVFGLVVRRRAPPPVSVFHGLHVPFVQFPTIRGNDRVMFTVAKHAVNERFGGACGKCPETPDEAWGVSLAVTYG